MKKKKSFVEKILQTAHKIITVKEEKESKSYRLQIKLLHAKKK